MAGRPTKITPKALEKLDDAFSLGHTDEEACIIAQIDPKTLYNYCKKHPNYSSKKELLKHSPKLIARRNIVKRLKVGDIKISKWYLERKARDEFNVRQEVNSELEISKSVALDELSKDIRKILERPMVSRFNQ